MILQLLLLLAIVANFSVADDQELTGNLRKKHTLDGTIPVINITLSYSILLIYLYDCTVGYVHSINKTSTLSNCLCNWVVGCASDSDCCPGLQCNLFNGWSQCLGKSMTTFFSLMCIECLILLLFYFNRTYSISDL